MFVTVLSRTVDPALAAQSTARGLSLMVADAVAAMIDDGRWSPHWPLLAEIRDLATLVGRLHDEIGDLCEQALAESRVEAMARAAYEIMIQARLARAACQAAACPVGDAVLFDVQAEGILIGAFSLLAI
jgi:hypothetical protein